MGKSTRQKQQDVLDTASRTPMLRLPDADSIAELALAQGMEYCAQKMGLADAQAAVELVQQGDRTACSYCHYSIATQVAENMGSLDKNVKAVYLFDCDATSDDVCLGSVSTIIPLHLIARVDRKTDALTSLIESMNRALAEDVAAVLGTSPTAHVLHVETVDDQDVASRRGYGAILTSLHHRPMKVWER